MRIRSIKPEFWRSPDISALAIEDRLLFIGLWSYVDDNGVGQDRLPLICADLFADDLSVSPHDTLMRVQDGLKRLQTRRMITRYTVNGRDFLEVNNWNRHQKINRPSPGRFPKSDHDSAIIHEDSLNTHDTLSAGTEEQGNRGTGEQLTILVNADASTDQPTDDRDDTTDTTDTTPAPTKRKTSPYTKEFLEWWEHYPRKVSKGEAFKAWKQIPDRDLAALTAGADRYANDPNRTEEFTKHPASWLRGRCWEDEDPLPQRGRDARPAIATTDQRMMQAQALKQTGGQPQWNATRSLTY